MIAPARVPVDLVVTLTVDELREIIREELQAASAAEISGVAPARLLVGGADLGRMLGCSRTQVHRLRLEGAPTVKLGDSYRFEPAAVLAWLKERGQP